MSVYEASAIKDDTLFGRIPVRNIWLLFAYASDLAHLYSQHAVSAEEAPSIFDLVA